MRSICPAIWPWATWITGVLYFNGRTTCTTGSPLNTSPQGAHALRKRSSCRKYPCLAFFTSDFGMTRSYNFFRDGTSPHSFTNSLHEIQRSVGMGNTNLLFCWALDWFGCTERNKHYFHQSSELVLLYLVNFLYCIFAPCLSPCVSFAVLKSPGSRIAHNVLGQTQQCN